jgi:hypothetical protein
MGPRKQLARNQQIVDERRLALQKLLEQFAELKVLRELVRKAELNASFTPSPIVQ